MNAEAVIDCTPSPAITHSPAFSLRDEGAGPRLENPFMNEKRTSPAPVTRRTFLKNGVVLTAGIAALSPAARAQTNQNSKLRIYQIGAGVPGAIGDMQRGQLKNYKRCEFVGFSDVDQAAMDKVHKELKSRLAHEITFVTLSEKGVYYANSKSELIPSHLRNVADVSGAGDTVIATAAIVYALTKNPAMMAELANIAGGLVCEEVGVVPIDRKNLLEESIQLLTE